MKGKAEGRLSAGRVAAPTQSLRQAQHIDDVTMLTGPAPAVLDLDDILKGLPPLATVPQAQGVLTLSKSSLYALLESGRLAHVRLGGGGGAIRIPRAAIAQYLRDCARGV
jgi:excisionase family DNA binding protein